MAENLQKTLSGVESRIRQVQKYVDRLEEENAQLKLQIEEFQQDIDHRGKGEGGVLAKKNIALTKRIRKYEREREFLAEKIKTLIGEIGELKRHVG